MQVFDFVQLLYVQFCISHLAFFHHTLLNFFYPNQLFQCKILFKSGSLHIPSLHDSSGLSALDLPGTPCPALLPLPDSPLGPGCDRFVRPVPDALVEKLADSPEVACCSAFITAS